MTLKEKVHDLLLHDMGGNRGILYALPLCAFGLVVVAHLLLVPSAPSNDGRDALARAIAMHHKLTKLEAANLDTLKAAVTKAFKDGQAIAAKVKPIIVVHGTTPTHVETSPETGAVKVTNTLDAVVATIPADGNPYVRADITTEVVIDKFKFNRTFTETVVFDKALILDERPPCKECSPGETTPTHTATRSLLGLDAGLVAGTSSVGWEIGARYYPASFAFNAKWAEARLGFYARGEVDSIQPKLAVGMTLLLGIGKGK